MQLIHRFMSDFGAIGLKEIGIIMAVLVMDAALSGDNSIAINALAMDVSERLRTKTIWFGMTLAAVLRVAALACASFIMTNPWVQILGALYLLRLCVVHLRKEEEEAGETERKKKSSFIAVLVAIGFLDLSLSLDNVIAVVAMSNNLAVIVLGVLASIAMLAVATQVVRSVMKRYPSLETAAYVILGFLGTIMLLEHTSEFVLWVGEKIAVFHNQIAALHYKVGDIGEILGVAAIIAVTIVREEITRRRQRSKAHKAARVQTTAAGS